jgi:hypothetical protein
MTKLEKEKLDAAGHGKQRFFFNNILFLLTNFFGKGLDSFSQV